MMIMERCLAGHRMMLASRALFKLTLCYVLGIPLSKSSPLNYLICGFPSTNTHQIVNFIQRYLPVKKCFSIERRDIRKEHGSRERRLLICLNISFYCTECT